MNKAKSIGRYFVCLAPQGGGSPLIDEAHTYEKEEPFRKGKGYLIRLPFTGNKPTTGLVVGMWQIDVQ